MSPAHLRFRVSVAVVIMALTWVHVFGPDSMSRILRLLSLAGR